MDNQSDKGLVFCVLPRFPTSLPVSTEQILTKINIDNDQPLAQYR